jgi:hypothetical protein
MTRGKLAAKFAGAWRFTIRGSPRQCESPVEGRLAAVAASARRRPAIS